LLTSGGSFGSVGAAVTGALAAEDDGDGALLELEGDEGCALGEIDSEFVLWTKSAGPFSSSAKPLIAQWSLTSLSGDETPQQSEGEEASKAAESWAELGEPGTREA